jgi:hypothetical protein
VTDPEPARRRVFHIALPEHWRAARHAPPYTMSWRHGTLAEVGFVHLL